MMHFSFRLSSVAGRRDHRQARMPAATWYGSWVVAVWLWASGALVWGAAPVITNQPTAQTIFYGDPVTFRVGASGTVPLAYQWLRNGTRLSGATASAYTLSAVSSNDHGAGFSVTVTNSSGAVTSQVAILTVDFGLTGPLQSSGLLVLSDNWKFNQTGINPGASWMLPGYNDGVGGWVTGSGVFDGRYSGTNPAPRATVAGETVGTQLAMRQSGTNVVTFYFRTSFPFHPGPASQVAEARLLATALLDDGAVFYLNGQEGYRVGVTNTAYNAWASRVVDATHEQFELPVTNLVDGEDNLIAVEVHQCNSGSSDVTFGLALEAAVSPRLRDTNAPVIADLIPGPGSTVSTLTQFEVHFSEAVQGVRAGDL
ncbi:MAG TPA: immunoglobulin domain-containing protein, partial [Candidatus Sulfotelmatobacter sp.]|nr:immunoglobulin domain-containing protein [Candidatus Sulfotelmatobacter sp.]